MFRLDLLSRFMGSRLFLLFLALGPVLHSHAQSYVHHEWKEGLDAFCEDLLSDFNYSSYEEVAEMGAKRYEAGLSAGDCFEAMKGKALILLAGCYGHQDMNLLPWLLNQSASKCSIESGYFELWKGGIYFNEGDKTSALGAFEKAAQWIPKSSLQHYYALSNVAAVQQSLYMNNAAIETFQVLIDLHPEQALGNAQSLINIAALQISIRELEEAYKTLLSVDTTALSSPWIDLWKLNKLEIAISLNEIDEVEALWMDLRKIPLDEVNVDAWGMLLNAALLVNDIEFFSEMERFVSRAVLPDNDPRLSMGFMPLLLMESGEVPMLTKWEAAKKVSEYYHGVQFTTYSELKEKINESVAASNDQMAQLKSEHEVTMRQLMVWGGILLLILILSNVAFARRTKVTQSSALRSLEGTGDKVDFELNDLRVIADALSTGKNTAKALLHLTKISRHTLQQEGSIEWSKSLFSGQLKDLNEQEMKVLMHMDAGYSAKEIATMLNVSPGHIYNLRSLIRKKLNLKENESLLDCLDRKAADHFLTENS